MSLQGKAHATEWMDDILGRRKTTYWAFGYGNGSVCRQKLNAGRRACVDGSEGLKGIRDVVQHGVVRTGAAFIGNLNILVELICLGGGQDTARLQDQQRGLGLLFGRGRAGGLNSDRVIFHPHA